MSITILKVEETAHGDVSFYFDREGCGAARWRTIVDTFEDAVELVERLRGVSAGRPDGDLTLGRGGRRNLPRAALPLVLAEWQEVPAVAAALVAGELRIDGDLVDRFLLPYARRWLAEHRSDHGPHLRGSGGADLSDLFE